MSASATEPSRSRRSHPSTFLCAVVYAADHGRLRRALDVVTDASTGIEHLVCPSATDAQNEDWLFGNDVHLAMTVEGAELVIVDVGDGPSRSTLDLRYACDAVIRRVSRPDPSGSRYVADEDEGEIQRTYRSVCASVGRWRWNGASLARVDVR